jgi:hypothetical protein
MQIRNKRRPPTRRERLRRRADDAVGRACWRATRWYGRQMRAELLRRPGR